MYTRILLAPGVRLLGKELREASLGSPLLGVSPPWGHPSFAQELHLCSGLCPRPKPTVGVPVPCILPILTRLSGCGAAGLREPGGCLAPAAALVLESEQRDAYLASNTGYLPLPARFFFLPRAPAVSCQFPSSCLASAKDKSRTSNSSLPLRKANTPFSFSQAQVLLMLPGSYRHCRPARYPIPVTD